MEPKTYIFSYRRNVTKTILVRRKWWNIFGYDELKTIVMSERVCIYDIPEDEASLIMSASAMYWNSPTGRLMLRLMGNSVINVQLEIDIHAKNEAADEGTVLPHWMMGRGHDSVPSEYVRTEPDID